MRRAALSALIILFCLAPAPSVVAQVRTSVATARLRFDVHYAVEFGELEHVRDLLIASPGLVDAFAPGGNDITPLHVAVLAGRDDMVPELLARGSIIDIFSAAGLGMSDLVAQFAEEDELWLTELRSGMTPLQWAAWAGQPLVIDTLVNYGADVTVVSENGFSALHAAAANGHRDAIQRLVALGVKIDATTSDGNTPLLLAAAAGHHDAVAMLLEEGAAVDSHDRDGRSPLWHATDLGHLPLIDRLLDGGASYREDTGAYEHARRSPRRVVARRALLQRPSQRILEVVRCGLYDTVCEIVTATPMAVRLTDPDEGNALQIAARQGDFDVAMALLDAGALPATGDDAKDWPIYLAAERGHAPIVTLLEQKLQGAAPPELLAVLGRSGDLEAHLRTDAGDWGTLLAAAVAGGDEDTITLMLDRHPNGPEFEAGMRTAIDRALLRGRAEAVQQIFVRLENDPAIRDRVLARLRTALPRACREGHAELVQWMLEHGADANGIFDDDGDQLHPLQIAARAGHTDVVRALLLHEAETNARAATAPSITALRFARMHGHTETAALLRRLGGRE